MVKIKSTFLAEAQKYAVKGQRNGAQRHKGTAENQKHLFI